MDITRKDINIITFQDVIDFCKQRIIENLFLDYKKNKPSDLTKHIAGFSNAAGGLIIIGVEEDDNGYPKNWEGIENTNKPTDWAHQMANNVIPLPSYEAAVTDEVDGKVFLLIRILEGDSAPYVTRNDPTVWVRTGNIRTPIEAANREDLIRLVNKGVDSDKYRRSINDTLDLQFAEMEKHQQQEDFRKGKLVVYKSDDKRSLLKVSVTPFKPMRKIINVKELGRLDKLMQNFAPDQTSLLSMASNAMPVTNGLAYLRYRDSSVESLHINDTGAVAKFADIAETNGAGNKSIWVGHISKHITELLLSASLMYRSYGYSGLVMVHVELSDIRGANIYRVTMGGSDIADDDVFAVSNSHQWDYQMTTAQLNNEESLITCIAELTDTIHWDLGDYGLGIENLVTVIESRFNWKLFGL